MTAVMTSWLPSRRRERRAERTEVPYARYGDHAISAPIEAGWNDKSVNTQTSEIIIYGNDDSDQTLVSSSPDLGKDDIIIIGEDKLFDSTSPEPSPVTIPLPWAKKSHKRTTSTLQEDKVKSTTSLQSIRSRSQSQPPVAIIYQEPAVLPHFVPFENITSTSPDASYVPRSKTPGAHRRAVSPFSEHRAASPFGEGRRTASPFRGKRSGSPFTEQRSWSTRNQVVERNPSLAAVSILSPVSEDFPRGQPSPIIDVASLAASSASPPPPALPTPSLPEEEPQPQAPHPSQSPALLAMARHVHSPEQIERAASGMSQRTAFRRPSTSNGTRPENMTFQNASPPLGISRPGSRGVGIGETGFMRSSSRGPIDDRTYERALSRERGSRRAQSVEPVMYRQDVTYRAHPAEPTSRIPLEATYRTRSVEPTGRVPREVMCRTRSVEPTGRIPREATYRTRSVEPTGRVPREVMYRTRSVEPTSRVRDRDGMRGESMPRSRESERERRREQSRARSSHRDLERSRRSRRDSMSDNDASGEETSDEVEIGLDTRAEAAYPSVYPSTLPSTTYNALQMFPPLPDVPASKIIPPPRSNTTTPLASQYTRPSRAHTVSPSMMGRSFYDQNVVPSIDSHIVPEPIIRAQTSISARNFDLYRSTPEPEKPNSYLTGVAVDYANILQDVTTALTNQEESQEAREGRSIVKAASRVASRAASKVRGASRAREGSRARAEAKENRTEGLNILAADIDLVQSEGELWG